MYGSRSSKNPAQRRIASLVAIAIGLLVIAATGCGTTVPPTSTPLPPPTATTVPAAPAAPTPAPTQPAASLGQSTGQMPPLAALTALPSIADLVDSVEPRVVSISVRSLVSGLYTLYSEEGAGSGFIIRPNGYIVTNNHVISGAREIIVNLPTGQSYTARLVGRDSVTDIAILKIEADNLPAATFANNDKMRVGDWVLSIGNALSLKGGPTVTLGIVSGLNRTINTEAGSFYGLIQTDAAINDGNSGGPLIDMNGNVVGVTQAILRQTGLGFAVSADTAVPVIESLINFGRVVRPSIGFDGQDVTSAIANELRLPVREGVIVTQISRTGPAYTAGIRIGDVITRIDGFQTPDVETWLHVLWSYKVGDHVQVEYIRAGQINTAVVTLAERTG
ncbi:MAG: PDZ domain-containing protein [SAR202 cluster bacterium]|nr:PDZ domain-containing protein [SAR202 cluster bacterium]